MSEQREPLKILVFSASLRAESLNTRLARLAADAVERHGATVDLASMRDFDARRLTPTSRRVTGPRRDRKRSVNGWRQRTGS